MRHRKSIGPLKIRAAGPDDAVILALWDTRAHVIAASYDNPDIPPKEPWDWPSELAPRDDGTSHWLALLALRPIGVMQIIDPASERTQYWGAMPTGFRAIDIWIGEVDCLGRGYGSQMMRWAIDYCFADKTVHTILVDPLFKNTDARRFYARLGFVKLERRRFDDQSDCMVMRLKRGAGQKPLQLKRSRGISALLDKSKNLSEQ